VDATPQELRCPGCCLPSPFSGPVLAIGVVSAELDSPREGFKIAQEERIDQEPSHSGSSSTLLAWVAAFILPDLRAFFLGAP